MYRGDQSIFSNFFPAPFNLGGEDFVHVEQFYQYKNALHNEDFDTAERILKLSNPWRIKVLGDNIESKSSWIPKRMKTLYEGVSAKFRQNWPLHNELLRTKNLKLYEATTDLYFTCGVGFESKKWQSMDWTGENVAGLIVMKVRDEFLLESQECSDNNTLTQIAADRDDSGNMDTDDHDSSPLESTLIQCDDSSLRGSSESHPVSSQTSSYTDAVKSPRKKNDYGQNVSYGGQGPSHNQRGHHGGRGRPSSSRSFYHPTPSHGRGHGSGRYQCRGTFHNRRSQENLSSDDKNFLYGKSMDSRLDEDGYITPRRTTKSPTPNVQSTPNIDVEWPAVQSLTEHQKKGLVELGLIPGSAFVNNIVATTKKTPN